MHRITILWIILICLAHSVVGQTNIVWTPGDTLSRRQLAVTDPDSLFRARPIDDGVFRRMWLKTYKRGCTTRRRDLRYLRLLHVNTAGQTQMGELVCHKSIAADLLDIFRRLYRAGYRIERIVLPDNYNADDETSMAANNTSCFNFRSIRGSKKISRHSLGLAVDINPRYNPCVHRNSGLVEPANGKPFAHNRRPKNAASLPVKLIDKQDLCYKLFIAHGFRWGGDWKTSVDYQHFEK